MIDPALLADIQGSTNAILIKVCDLVRQYNAAPQTVGQPQMNQNAIKLIDKVMKHSAHYLTSKPPNAKDKNTRKWNALTAIANAAAAEAKNLGVKLLSSPTNFREIKGDGSLGKQSYWLERVDPLHRPGFVLSKEYESWLIDIKSITKRKSFWRYLKGRNADMNVQMVKGMDPTDVTIPIVDSYRIQFDPAGTARDIQDNVFSTRDLETHFSGLGWGIFVCSPEGHLYSRTHEVAVFHHSSFLAGKPVAAAGEILIDEGGKVRILTAKTGHYRAGADEMRRLVQIVPQIPPDAYIVPVFANKKVYRVDDFRARGQGAKICTKAEVDAKIPHWARNKQSITDFINAQPVSRPMDPNAPAFSPRPRMNPNAPAFQPRN